MTFFVYIFFQLSKCHIMNIINWIMMKDFPTYYYLVMNLLKTKYIIALFSLPVGEENISILYVRIFL